MNQWWLAYNFPGLAVTTQVIGCSSKGAGICSTVAIMNINIQNAQIDPPLQYTRSLLIAIVIIMIINYSNNDKSS